MKNEYNEHESGDEDGMGCIRGMMYAFGIQAVLIAIGAGIWYLCSS